MSRPLPPVPPLPSPSNPPIRTTLKYKQSLPSQQGSIQGIVQPTADWKTRRAYLHGMPIDYLHPTVQTIGNDVFKRQEFLQRSVTQDQSARYTLISKRSELDKMLSDPTASLSPWCVEDTKRDKIEFEGSRSVLNYETQVDFNGPLFHMLLSAESERELVESEYYQDPSRGTWETALNGIRHHQTFTPSAKTISELLQDPELGLCFKSDAHREAKAKSIREELQTHNHWARFDPTIHDDYGKPVTVRCGLSVSNWTQNPPEHLDT